MGGRNLFEQIIQEISRGRVPFRSQLAPCLCLKRPSQLQEFGEKMVNRIFGVIQLTV